MTLRELDDRLVPAAARLLRRGLAPAPPAAIRTLMGVALAAAMTGSALVAEATDTAPALPAARGVPVVVGPAAGQAVDDYVDEAAARLAQRAATRPEETVPAVVDLVAYQTPAGVRALLRFYSVTAVYLRLGATGSAPEVRTLPVRDLGAELDRAYAALARRVPPAEATALRRSCACVAAVAVTASGRTLAALGTRAGIRVVDPLPVDVAPALVTFRPLLPDAHRRVAGEQPLVPPPPFGPGAR